MDKDTQELITKAEELFKVISRSVNIKAEQLANADTSDWQSYNSRYKLVDRKRQECFEFLFERLATLVDQELDNLNDIS